ncbi:20241_t:CDS:2 [Rhizophagus irregularis]|nr:20241_t:CDS:2 [Rhizophagus irregularis]
MKKFFVREFYEIISEPIKLKEKQCITVQHAELPEVDDEFWNDNVGIYTVGDGLLLNKWYHLTYTLSDSEKRMDIFINGVWTAMRSWILSGCVDGEIGYNFS